ncbi:MAG: LysE family transporter [Archaeoglobaceae archaeon]
MLEFLIKVVTISSSGALAPGPLSAATAAIGTQKGWKGGFLVSFGHFIVEVPLVFLIAFFISFATLETMLRPLAALGGIMLIFFGYLTIKSALKLQIQQNERIKFNPFLTGVFLTAFNPFFIAWWFSIGSALVSESIILFGSFGVILLIISHTWIDFVWLSAIAYLTSLKGVILKFHRALLLSLGFLVVFFGIDYLYFALLGLHIFP